MDIAPIVLFVGMLVFLAHLFSGLFSRTKIPDVLLLMVIGLIIGPVLGIVSPSDFGSVGPIFATITLVILLFQSGIDLRLSMLRKALRGAVMITVVNFVVTMAAVGITLRVVAGTGWTSAFLLGAILGGTSSAVIIPMLEHLKMQKESSTILYLESALSDVLCIVVALAFVQSQQFGGLDVGLIAGKIISSFLLAGIIGVLGAFGWSVILDKVRTLQNSIFTTPAFVFIIYGIAELLGFSGAIAALAFGVTIGNIEFVKIPSLTRYIKIQPIALNNTEKTFFSEVVFILKTFFFVYIGLSIQLTNVWWIYLGLVLTLVIFMLRIPVVWASLPRSTPVSDVSMAAVMVPKGLAAAVLAAIPAQQGIAGGDMIEGVTYAVILFSIILCSILVFLLEKTSVLKLYCWMLPEFRKNAGDVQTSDKSQVTAPAE